MTQYYQIICRLCGTAHGVRSDHPEGKSHIRVNKRSYWEDTMDFDPDRPLGTIQESQGRGKFAMIGTFEAEEDITGSFPFYRIRILRVIQEALGKGWISKEEVEDAIGGKVIIAPTPTPGPKRPIRPVTPVRPLPPPGKEIAKMSQEELEAKITELEDLMDEENKPASLKRLERALEEIDEDQISGVDDLQTAIQEYKDVERAGKTPEEYVQEKDSAFEHIIDTINDLELVEE
jgi:hypothetical protein